MTFTPTQPALGRTVGDFCDQVLGEYLDRNEVVELDRLKEAVSATADEVFVSFSASGLRPQARMEIDDELLHIWADADVPGGYVVQRGVGHTTAALHEAGAVIRVNPRWTRSVIATQLAREIRSWPTNVGAVATADFPVANGAETVDLDGLVDFDVRRVLRVQRTHASMANSSRPGFRGILERRQDLTAFPSGYALRFPLTPGVATVVRVAVLYAPPVPAEVDYTADLGADYHLSSRLADAAMLGVAGRLLLTDEINRTDDRSQSRPRLAEQVPPGHRLQTGQGLLAERDRLLKTEAETILNEYPPSF